MTTYDPTLVDFVRHATHLISVTLKHSTFLPLHHTALPLAVANLWVRYSIRAEQRHHAHDLALLVAAEVVGVQQLVAGDGAQPGHALQCESKWWW